MQQKPLGLQTHTFREGLLQNKVNKDKLFGLSSQLALPVLNANIKEEGEMAVRRIQVNKVENGIL